MEKPTTASADDLGRAHASLLADLRKLEQVLQADPGVSYLTLNLRDRLVAMRSHITEHFGFEERNGWMDAVRKQEPRLEHAIQQILEEHRHLVQSLDTLIEEADAATKLEDLLRQKVLRWIQRVREHEASENELLEDAFVEDLGAGD